MNYTVLQGIRKESKIYCHDGYSYYKMSYTSVVTKLRCMQFAKNKCKGKCEINGDNKLTVTCDHRLRMINWLCGPETV